MRIRELQDNLRKLLNYDLAFSLQGDNFSLDMELILSAKVMAVDLLREENPKQIILEAFIQLFLVASILNLDLEKEIEKIIINYTDVYSQGGSRIF